MRHRFKQQLSFKDRLSAWAGGVRDELLRFRPVLSVIS